MWRDYRPGTLTFPCLFLFFPSQSLVIRYLLSISTPKPNHYQTLGLDRGCTRAQIRDAYRQLAKRFHPDANPGSDEAEIEIKALNHAYEILSDPARRRAYDRELHEASRAAATGGTARFTRNISQEVRIRIEDFLRGTVVDVKVN